MPVPVNTNQEFLPSFDDIAKKACAATGGTWDEQNQACIPQGGGAGAAAPVCIHRENYQELMGRPTKMRLYAWIAGGVTAGFLLGSWK